MKAAVLPLGESRLEHHLHRSLGGLGPDPLQQVTAQTSGILDTLLQTSGHPMIVAENEVEAETLVPVQ